MNSDNTASPASEVGPPTWETQWTRADKATSRRVSYGAPAWLGTRDLPVGIDWIIFSSADGSDQLNSAEAAAFQAALDNGADLVVGERVSSPESRSNLQPVQHFGNDFACAWLALGWGRRFLDLGSLRIIHRPAFERLQLRDRGFGWNIEMQARALEERLRIAEVPVQYHPRQGGRPKISGHPIGMVKAGWAILWTIARPCDTRGNPPNHGKRAAA